MPSHISVFFSVLTGDHLQPVGILKNSYLYEMANIYKHQQEYINIIHNSNLQELDKRKILIEEVV